MREKIRFASVREMVGKRENGEINYRLPGLDREQVDPTVRLANLTKIRMMTGESSRLVNQSRRSM